MADPVPDFTGNVSPIRPDLFSDGRLGAALKSGDRGGTSAGMEALIDAKIAAAEARTDAKFATVIAKLDALADSYRSTTTDIRSIRGSIWTAAFAIMGLIIALVALLITVAPSAFSFGAQVREIAREEALLAQPAPAAVPSAAAPTDAQ